MKYIYICSKMNEIIFIQINKANSNKEGSRFLSLSPGRLTCKL